MVHGTARVVLFRRSSASVTHPEFGLTTLPVSSKPGAVRSRDAIDARDFGPSRSATTAVLTRLQNPTRCQNATPATNPLPVQSTAAIDPDGCRACPLAARAVRIMQPVWRAEQQSDKCIGYATGERPLLSTVVVVTQRIRLTGPWQLRWPRRCR